MSIENTRNYCASIMCIEEEEIMSNVSLQFADERYIMFQVAIHGISSSSFQFYMRKQLYWFLDLNNYIHWKLCV